MLEVSRSIDNLTIVIPFYNGYDTIDSLLQSIPSDIPIILVDDLSDSPLIYAKLSQSVNLDRIRILRLTTKGYFTGAVNAGISACTNDVLILNQDTEFIDRSWIETLSINRVTYSMIGECAASHPLFPSGYIHGTFCFITRDAIVTIGLLNAKLFPLWGSTAEYQLQLARRGYKVLPLQRIPGFIHKREKGIKFGTALQSLVTQHPELESVVTRTPPLISIIIPCYNYGCFLPDAIHSLIGGTTCLGDMPGQDFNAYEVIIVNDASTDNSGEIADSLANDFNGIRVIHHTKNCGSAAAHNTGIQNSYGFFITSLDADDMYESTRLSSLFNIGKNNQHSVVCDDTRVFNATQGRLDIWPMQPYNFQSLLQQNSMHIGTFYTRKAWEDAGGYPESFVNGREDWAFNIALGRAGYCGLMLRNPLYLYRRHDNNRTLGNTGQSYHESFLRHLQATFPDVYSGRYPKMCCGQPVISIPNTPDNPVGKPEPPIKSGMVRLHYIGKSLLSEYFDGGATHIVYNFGASSKPYGYVDALDVNGLLELREKGSEIKLFELAVD